MKIEKIVFAEQLAELPTERPEIKKMALINPTLSFGIPFIPTVFTFSVFVMLQGVTEKQINMKVEIVNMQNQQTIFGGEFPIEVNASSPLAEVLPSDIVGTNYGIQVNNVIIETEGNYECIITLPEGEKKSEKLRFAQRRAIKNSKE